MATTKKTQAKKKAVTPKKAAEQIEAIPTAPEPVKPVREVEDMVSYVIPVDPAFETTDQYFEWNFNGINYRFKRGEVLTHPRSFYEEVSNKLRLREHVSPEIAEYKNNSKKLN